MLNLWVQVEVLWLCLLQLPSGNNISLKEALPNTMNPSVLWTYSYWGGGSMDSKCSKLALNATALWKMCGQLLWSSTYTHHMTQKSQSWEFTLEKWGLCSQKKLYMNVYSLAFFVIAKIKLETTHMSFNGWMVKQTVLHPSHIIPLSNEKEWTVVHVATWMALKGFGSERSQSQKVIDGTIPFMTVSEKQNDGDGEEIRGWGRVWL